MQEKKQIILLFFWFLAENHSPMEYQDQTGSPFASRGITKYVRLIIIATFIVFGLQALASVFNIGDLLKAIFGVNRFTISRLFLWQPATYIFLHSTRNLWHIGLNMLGLYFLGCEIENVLGHKRFLKLYFGTGIIAGLGWLLISWLSNTLNGSCIGASGAVLGMLGVFGGMFPKRRITLLLFFIIPINLAARTLALGIMAISTYAIIFISNDIADSAHLFGCVAGYLYGLRIHKNPGLLDSHLYSQPNSDPITSFFSNIRAKIRRSQFKVVPHEEAPPTQQDIDRILDKINAQGMKSLTIRERQALRRAGDKK